MEYELNIDQEIGEEISNKLNNNYVITKLSFIYNCVVNENNIINEFFIYSNAEHIFDLFLVDYYNDIINYNVLPIVYCDLRCSVQGTQTHLRGKPSNYKNTYKFVFHEHHDIINIIKIKFTINEIKEKLYYRSWLMHDHTYYNNEYLIHYVYSNYFKDVDDLKKYLNDVNSDIKIDDILKLFGKYFKHFEASIYKLTDDYLDNTTYMKLINYDVVLNDNE